MRYKDQLITDRLFTIIIYVFLWGSLLVVLYPLIYILSASFSDPKAVLSGEVWLLPIRPTLIGYKAVFDSKQLMGGFENTFYYTVFGTLISIFLTMTAAYPLAQKKLPGKKVFMFAFTFTMLFSGGLIPYYMVVKTLGFIDTRWSLLIPGALSVYNIILARTFFMNTIPVELNEAAEMDGCSDFRFFTAVVLPLSRSIIAVLILIYAVAKWNSYFEALIFLSRPRLHPLQLVLRGILILNTPDASMMAKMEVNDTMHRLYMIQLLKYTTIVVSSVPILLIYPFAQKYFVKGIMIGSLKG